MTRTVLPNGLRVVTAHRAGTPLAALKLFLKVGSRHDGAHPGMAHAVEHLLFQRPWEPGTSPFDRIERAGGELNAITHREYTALQAVVLGRYVPEAVRVFADLLAPLDLEEGRLAREREVIAEEIAEAADTQTAAWDLFLRALWGDDPLARPITGSPETVAALDAATVQAHFQRYLVPGRTVLAAAGAVDHDEVVALAARHFPWPPAPAWVDDFPPPRPGPRRAHLERQTRTTTLVVGVEAVPLADPRRPAVRLLDTLLGRGASARLHRRLRVTEGLVYHVATVAMAYEDRGYLAACTRCHTRHAPAVLTAVLEEFGALATAPPLPEELSAAVTRYEGGLARHFETVLSLASVLGIEELFHRVEPFEEAIARARRVTPAEVQDVAAHLFDLERVAVASVGRLPGVEG